VGVLSGPDRREKAEIGSDVAPIGVAGGLISAFAADPISPG